MTDVLESGRDPWQRPRWLVPLLVVLALIGGFAWFVADRHRRALAEREDRPYREFLTHLTGFASGPSDRQITVGLNPEPEEFRPPSDGVMRVLRLDLADVRGRRHVVVVNHFRGSGPGPLVDDLEPFRESLAGLEATFTLETPAVCGRAPNGHPPPLLLTVELPSGKRMTQRVPILGPHVSTDWSTGKRYSTLDWTHAMAQAACHPVDH